MSTNGNKKTYREDRVIEDDGTLIRPAEEKDLAPAGEADPEPRGARAFLARLRGGLPAFRDDGQRRAFRNILRFLALVLVFTLIARGTSAATMPKVSLASPQRGEIAETVRTSATVQAAYTQPVLLPTGLKIDQVLVVPGQKVEPVTPLFLLDAEKLETQQRREQLKLEEMNLNLGKLQRGEPYDSSALIGAQNTLAWAEADLNTTRAQQDAAVAAANNTVNAAAAERDAAQSALDAVNGDESATEEQRKQAQERLNTAQAAVPAAEQVRDTAVQSAEETVSLAARTVESSRVSLSSAQMTDEKSRREAADQKAQNALDAQTLELDIAEQQQLLETYAAAAGDGHVYAGVSGTVLEVLDAGATVAEEPAALISDESGGYRAEGLVDKAAAEQLSSGDGAEVGQSRGFSASLTSGATVLSVDAPGENGLARVLFKLPQGEWKQGQSVEMIVTRSRQDYPMVVPLSAVHQSNNEYYLFVVTQRNGVMGAESVVSTVAVTIDAKNNEYAAVSGPLAPDEKVVVSTSKPLENGDKVRLGDA